MLSVFSTGVWLLFAHALLSHKANVSGDHLNKKFKDFLSQFEYKKVEESRLRKAIISFAIPFLSFTIDFNF